MNPAYPPSAEAPPEHREPAQYDQPPQSGGPAYGAPPIAPPPAPGRRALVVVLAIATVLFFAIAGAMTGLYLSTNSDLDKANETISAADSEIADLEKSLEDAQAALVDAEEGKGALSTCVTEVTKVFNALDRTGEASAELVGAAEVACDNAQKYVE